MKLTAPLVLPPLSALYRVITKTRLSMYRRGTFRTTKLDRPVISIGNITTGGTGKTPLVEYVARLLSTKGLKVCVLTRGYGRTRPDERVLVSDGESVYSTAAEAGDEAFLLATNLKGLVAVISDSNRIAAGEDAIKHLGTDCFVLDDGFQHLRLARDLDIVVIDATNPWGGGRLLPEGRLREPLEGLNRADCIVLTRTDQVDNIQRIREELQAFSQSPTFTSRMKTIDLVPLNGAPPNLLGPIGAFCGVGNPQSFFGHLRREGYAPVFERAMRDHQTYTQDHIDSICAGAAKSGAVSLITTAKDAVKLKSLNLSLPTYALEVQISIDNDAQFKELILASIGKPTDLINYAAGR
jgi:tetraacyldisaccharide 4'-kinase